MRVLVVNGPNLDLLGTRRPEVYGTTTLGELEAQCREWGAALGFEVTVFQSNHEGAIIDRLHEAIGRSDGIIINPGALAHYSYALHDAIESVAVPVVEVHISDITAREPWRATSVVAPACVASFSGHGIAGYRMALESLAARGDQPAARSRQRSRPATSAESSSA
jgi:3-dehydroquinate dehydratase-2